MKGETAGRSAHQSAISVPRQDRSERHRALVSAPALLVTSALILATGLAAADSLYKPQSAFTTLFSDRKALKVGDIIYVLITETAQATQDMSDSTASETKGEAEMGVLPLKF